MAFFVFNWTKRTYILAVLSLVLLVITTKHKEYFYCEEKPLSSFEKFAIWLGFMEKPKPCPGKEDLYTMAVEMSVSAAAVIASTAIPRLLNWSLSLMGRAAQAIKGGFKYLKGIRINGDQIFLFSNLKKIPIPRKRIGET
ncbi:uncharacterized protein LOC134263377 [Saccostrea cucullata]|uniref:uncharacterized protein LOC134263377 n=1 Tax=Saccostrea cuccullata TaxID=36930 RepID=UPI002ED416EA